MRRGDLTFLAAMIALFFLCCVQDPRSETHPFSSFHPLPDAIEYAVGASRLAAGERFDLVIDGVTIPSRYPPGFPLLIAAAYRVLGNGLANAYWVSITCGAAAIPLLFLLVQAWIGDRAAAGWATFFLATNSLVLRFAPLVMTEILSMTLALAALNLAVRLDPGSRTSGFAALGAVLGFAVMVRSANVILIPLTALTLVGCRGRMIRPGQWTAIAAPIALAVTALAAYNAATFGSPLRDGYAFYTPRTMFTWEAFTAQAPSYLGTLVLAHGGRTLGVDGPFYGPLIPGLLLFGMIELRRRGRTDVPWLVAAWVVVFVVFFGSYFFFDFRFFVPLLPMILVPAACGTASLLRRHPPVTRAVASTVIVLVYVVQPGSAGTSPLALARQHHAAAHPPTNHLHTRALNAYMERIGADPATDVVVTALNLVYLDHFSNRRYTIVPLSPEQDYGWVAEIRARMPWQEVDAMLAAGRRVYVTDFAAEGPALQEAYRTLAGTHRLEPVDADARLARVYPRP